MKNLSLKGQVTNENYLSSYKEWKLDKYKSYIYLINYIDALNKKIELKMVDKNDEYGFEWESEYSGIEIVKKLHEFNPNMSNTTLEDLIKFSFLNLFSDEKLTIIIDEVKKEEFEILNFRFDLLNTPSLYLSDTFLKETKSKYMKSNKNWYKVIYSENSNFDFNEFKNFLTNLSDNYKNKDNILNFNKNNIDIEGIILKIKSNTEINGSIYSVKKFYDFKYLFIIDGKPYYFKEANKIFRNFIFNEDQTILFEVNSFNKFNIKNREKIIRHIEDIIYETFLNLLDKPLTIVSEIKNLAEKVSKKIKPKRDNIEKINKNLKDWTRLRNKILKLLLIFEQKLEEGLSNKFVESIRNLLFEISICISEANLKRLIISSNVLFRQLVHTYFAYLFLVNLKSTDKIKFPEDIYSIRKLKTIITRLKKDLKKPKPESRDATEKINKYLNAIDEEYKHNLELIEKMISKYNQTIGEIWLKNDYQKIIYFEDKFNESIHKAEVITFRDRKTNQVLYNELGNFIEEVIDSIYLEFNFSFLDQKIIQQSILEYSEI